MDHDPNYHDVLYNHLFLHSEQVDIFQRFTIEISTSNIEQDIRIWNLNGKTLKNIDSIIIEKQMNVKYIMIVGIMTGLIKL